MKDRNTGKSRGFGFVVYYDPADAARAVEQEHIVDGRRCEAKYAEPKGNGTRCSRIFVARIHPSVTDAEFRDYFGTFGTVQVCTSF
jgi:RNA-binding protein Musashi